MKITHPILSAPTSPQHAADMAAALIAHHRGTFGDARMEDDDPPADDPSADDPPKVNEHGYPDATPVKDMTVEQQLAYHQHHSRKWESRAKSREDYDAIKAERDRLKQAGMSPDEKALEEAKQAAAEAARAEERATFGKQLVATKLEAALSRRGLDEERIAALVGPLDHTFFLTDSGEVDADRVSAYASGFGQDGKQWPDMGQGNRGRGAGKTSLTDAMEEARERRRGKKNA